MVKQDMEAIDRMLKWFDYEHLEDEGLRETSKLFHTLAVKICIKSPGVEGYLDPGPERTVCLRKLLEAKEAAIRASLYPGG
jgi:hypothetical protein